MLLAGIVVIAYIGVNFTGKAVNGTGFVIRKSPGGSGGGCQDKDKDGYYDKAGCGTVVDCNDGDRNINPGAKEICGNSIDENCDGLIAACMTTSTSTSIISTSTILSDPSLIGYWKFDETGNVTADSSGYGNDGNLINGPTRVAGKMGQAILFDGSDDYIGIAHSPSLNSYPITVMAWVKTNAANFSGIVNKYYPASANGWQIFMNNGKLCAWYFKDGSSYIWDGTSCTLAATGYNDNLWHHVAFTVDATGGKLYVDGVLKSSLIWTGIAGGTTTIQEIGIASYPGTATPYLPGMIDEVRVYNRALSQAEIQAIM